jgi:hypothetical protein
MTTKTEMTLENVCFRYDGSQEAVECIQLINKKYEVEFGGVLTQKYWITKDGHPVSTIRKPSSYNLISPSDYLLLLSAPESQAHLLTDKHSNDMAHVSEHKSAMEYLKEPSLKELSQPPVMEGREETLQDVIKRVSPFGTMTISNPKMLIALEDFIGQKTSSLQSEVEQLKGLLKEAQPFCGTMLRGKIEHYTSK